MKYSEFSRKLEFDKLERNLPDPENKLAWLTHYLQGFTSGNKSLNGQVAESQEYYGKAGDYASQYFGEDGLQKLIPFEWDVPYPPVKNPKFTFIDLFAGIGGFRMALQNLKGKCVFSSEWDRFAQKTYAVNYGEVPFGDIKDFTDPDKISDRKLKQLVPDHDVLAAGFPCQAFSIAGKRGGFNDTRGTLFFDVARIIKNKKPKAIFLENVKGLMNHDRGKTLATILNVLRNDLGYYVPDPQIVNAKNFGVPQNRERIFIVGFRGDLEIEEFKYPEPEEKIVAIEDILEDQEVSVKYYLSDQYLQTLVDHKHRHASKGNGFGYEIIQKDGIANAIVVGGMGRERNLVEDDRLTDFNPVTKITGTVNKQGIRRMTPKEWCRLQGFPDKFYETARAAKVSDAQLYKQLGNSVAVPAIQATANQLIKKLNKVYAQEV